MSQSVLGAPTLSTLTGRLPIESPSANFSVMPGQGFAPLQVLFKDQSSGVIDDGRWDFGDGSTVENVFSDVHIYSQPGNYLLTLTQTGPGGSDTRQTSITVLDSAATGTGQLELVGEVQSQDGANIAFIDALEVLDSNPNQIVFITQNESAERNDTPASAWRMRLHPGTGKSLGVDLQQERLEEVQNVNGVILESSSGILFTGGGSDGTTPPYYSTDNGENWMPANIDAPPHGSTFSLAEYEGQIYAGTGSDSFSGRVYRWLGNGNWELVWDFGHVRDIVSSMVVLDNGPFEKLLFMGSSGDFNNQCAGTVPVYLSQNGRNFIPTNGIPSCYHVSKLLVVDGRVIARVRDDAVSNEQYIYRWDQSIRSWKEITEYNLGNSNVMATSEGAVFAYGSVPGQTSSGIYQSLDRGASWHRLAELDASDEITSMTVHGNTLYLGTKADDDGTARIYRILRVRSSIPEGLVLWNRLGSDLEVLSSAVGPDLSFHSIFSGRFGNRKYVAGRYGNGVTLTGTDPGAGFLRNVILARPERVLNPTRGCVEFWYRQTAPPHSFSGERYALFQGPSVNDHFEFWIRNRPNDVPFIFFEPSFGGSILGVLHNIHIPNNQWLHLAGSWDREGIDGTNDTVRLYVDGALAASASDGPMGGSHNSEINIGAASRSAGDRYVIDNLKIWNFAKTDFSDRFVE